MVRVGLLGGNPYQRDLIQGWLADTPCVRTTTPLHNRHHQPHPPPPTTNSTSPTDIDLVVGIIDSPNDPTLDTCRHLTNTGQTLPLVTILLTPDPHVLQAAVDTGAAGLIAATSGPNRLAHAITAAANGAATLDPALSPIAMQLARSPHHADRFGLTPTETRVAACFPKGLTRRQIADQLNIGEETVKTHISNIYRKLNVSNRTTAIGVLQGRTPA